jgi:Holliday junction resolvase-like predicted endonuclease
MGEQVAARLLGQSGYSVSFMQARQKRGDLRVVELATGEVHYVEVKTARRGKDGKWRFTLYKKGKTDHRNADFVVLLAILESGRAVPFVIPIVVLEQRKQAVIGKHPESYVGKLAAYRQSGEIRLWQP